VHASNSEPAGGCRVPLVAWYEISFAASSSRIVRCARKYVATI
jgi:hypothetical protein